jgi:hypothetical protein
VPAGHVRNLQHRGGAIASRLIRFPGRIAAIGQLAHPQPLEGRCQAIVIISMFEPHLRHPRCFRLNDKESELITIRNRNSIDNPLSFESKIGKVEENDR